ncbi:MAG: hypothetical protein MK194_11285 [Roseibacillus sp.]|nr:hypothetical protein [Roseibacillus sp.]
MKAYWRGLLLWGLVTSLLPHARAHQELHHNIELDLRQMEKTGSLELVFTIHAPELVVGLEEAASALYNSDWLAQQSDQELNQLMTLGRKYLTGRFTVQMEEREPVDLASRLTFEDADAIRSGGTRGLSPGCLEASLVLSAPEGPGRLRLDHAADSGKRLLLVIDRPGAFPEVLDVAPGTHAVVALRGKIDAPIVPEVASHPDTAPARTRILTVTIVLAVLSAMGLILTRLRRSSRGKSPGS